MPDFQLRPITANDAAFLHRLMNHPDLLSRLHQLPSAPEDWQEAIRLWHSDPDEKGCIVIVEDEPIGWFAVNGLCSPERMPYIKMAVLLPPWQHKGIGRRVIARLCSRLQAEGFPAVRLFTDQDNPAAQRCYQQSGFRIIGSQEDTWPDGSPLRQYEMEKELNAPMQTYETPHYLFHYAADSKAEADIRAIAAEQEACYAYICHVLQTEPESKIHYHLCPSPEAVGHAYGDDEPCNGFCLAPSDIYAVYNDQVKCIGFHEDAHLISYTMGRPDCPAIREGLAMYFDRKWWSIHNMDWTAHYLQTGRYLPVHQLLERALFFAHDCSITYPIMGAFTDYLISTHGMEAYKAMYRQENIPAAMEAVYGATPEQLNERFVAYMKLFRLDAAVTARMEALLAEG